MSEEDDRTGIQMINGFHTIGMRKCPNKEHRSLYRAQYLSYNALVRIKEEDGMEASIPKKPGFSGNSADWWGSGQGRAGLGVSEHKA